MSARVVTAAILVIGDEVLSGRTQDANTCAIAQFLGPLGVEVREGRTVADDPAAIIAALNALRATYDYVFTTGGIGPTHDDITADAVAAAFGVTIDERSDALDLLAGLYAARGETLTPARRRMARIPEGANLIANSATGAPGFQIENVFVLAGVPGIMRAMLQDIPQRIRGGRVLVSGTVRAPGLREGDVAATLSAIQAAHPDIAIGSYPYFRGPEDYGVNLVARGEEGPALKTALQALSEAASMAGATSVSVEGQDA